MDLHVIRFYVKMLIVFCRFSPPRECTRWNPNASADLSPERENLCQF